MNKADCIFELKQIRGVYAGMRKEYGSCVDALDMAINALEQTTWIPCSERLPDTDRMVLVTAQPKTAPANVNRAYHTESGWHGSGSMANVTAWMELPEPYKGER